MSSLHIVIEPHADDAFLSLGGHIEQWVKDGDPVWIVTVFSGTRKRGRDGEAYAGAVGARWLGLGAKEPDDGGQPKEGTRVLQKNLPSLLVAAAGESKDREVIVYLPSGIKHPEHQEVRKAVARILVALAITRPARYYLDQPYAATQSNGQEVNELIKGRRITSYLRPHARKYRHIPLFKDQAKFFHFNPAAKLCFNIEMILE